MRATPRVPRRRSNRRSTACRSIPQRESHDGQRQPISAETGDDAPRTARSTEDRSAHGRGDARRCDLSRGKDPGCRAERGRRTRNRHDVPGWIVTSERRVSEGKSPAPRSDEGLSEDEAMTQEARNDDLTIGGKRFSSRLMVGTGKYKDFGIMREAIMARGAGIIPVSI